MELQAIPMNDRVDADRDITATVLRERSRLGNFIRQRVGDPDEAEDILQDVFQQFVEACRLPSPIEQVSGWLFQIARHRIVDRFRKHRELPLSNAGDATDGDDEEHRLDLALPSPEGGPEAAYGRTVLLAALDEALAELPAAQREVFVAHELDGVSFKHMAADTGVPVNTLLARKRYAVLHLRTRLQVAYDDLDL